MKKLIAGLAAAISLAQASYGDITSGLVLRLQLNEGSGLTATDSSGNGNNGSLVNMPGDNSNWTNGRIGSAVFFNPDASNDDVITVPETGLYNFSSGLAFTLSAWVRAASGPQIDGAGIIAKGTGAGGEQYAVDVSGGAYRFFVRNGTNFGATVLQTAITPNGAWQLVTAVFDSGAGVMKVLVNGQVVASTNTPPASLEDTPHELSIGARELSASSGYNLAFTGAIDEVRIYNRALTDADVQELYDNAGVVAPTFVVEPRSVNRFSGENVTLTSVVDGTIPLTYQWRKEGVAIPGANAANLTLTNLSLTNAGNYSVAVSNSAGGIVSSNAVLQVTVLPEGDFTSALVAHYKFDETSGTVAADSAGTNTASLVNFPGDGSEWVSGRIGGALRFNPPGDAIHDDLVITDGPIVFNNQDNFTFSLWLRLVDNEAGVNPRIITPNNNHWFLWSKGANGVGLFTSRPSPVPQLRVWKHFVMTYNRAASTYSLFVNGSKVVTNATPFAKAAPGSVRWVIGHAENVLGHGEYIRGDFDDVRIYNRILQDADVKGLYDAAGIFPLQITVHPVGRTRTERDNVSFTVGADGTLPFTIQWQHNGTNLVGRTNATLTLTEVSLASEGNYRAVLNNGAQTAISSNAFLQVLALPPPNLTEALVAHWTFDETSGSTVADSSGNGSSGTLFNFLEDGGQWVPGIIGGALHFNRNADIDDFVGIDAPLNLSNGDQFTFTFWLKRDGSPGLNNPRIITPLGTEHWVLWTPNRGVGFFTTVPSSQPNSNSWTHFAVVFDRSLGQYTLYVNGQREVSEAGFYQRANPMSLNSLWIIGHAEIADRHTDPWRGLMDDLRVYNRPLTVTEVESLYFADSPVGPRLTIRREGSSIQITWSAVAADYVLESSDSLDANAVWQDVTATPSVAAGRNTVTLDSSNGTRFYRLSKADPVP